MTLCGTASSLGARTTSAALGKVVSELDQMIKRTSREREVSRPSAPEGARLGESLLNDQPRTRRGEQEKAMTEDAMMTSDETLPDPYVIQTRCETAAYRCLRPITWRLEQISGLPPFSDFIEVRPGTDGLLVHERDPAEWAYLLVLYKDHPTYRLCGWLWGREAKQPHFKRREDDGLPAFFVPLDSELFHPAETLIDELVRRPLVTGRPRTGALA